MNFKRSLVETGEGKSAERPQARKGDITLSVFKGLREIQMRRFKRHPLTFVHRHRPGETQRHLTQTSEHPAAVFNAPLCRFGRNGPPGQGFD